MSRTPSDSFICVITGVNRGLGFEICRQFCTKFTNATLVGICRDQTKGKLTKENLLAEFPGMKIDIIQGDVSDLDSLKQNAEYIKTNYNQIDIVINNAGIADRDELQSGKTSKKIEEIFSINLRGCQNCVNAFLPVMSTENGRFVFVSSFASQMVWGKMSKESKQFCLKDNLTEDELNQWVKNYISVAKEGRATECGFSDMCYGVSKLMINCYTRIMSRIHPNISWVAVHPGWCPTDMGGAAATDSVYTGAYNILTFATISLTPDLNGHYFRQGNLVLFDTEKDRLEDTKEIFASPPTGPTCTN